MEDDVRKTAADAVAEKFRDLMAQRVDAVRQRGEVERLIRGIDRALFDCRAAGRLFGVDIELPEDVRPGIIVRPNPGRAGELVRPTESRETSKTLFSYSVRLPSETPSPAPAAAEAAAVAVPTVASTTLPAGEEPSIRDLILLYLKQAGASGIK
ncbi:MAG: hypothetical protein ACXVBG_24415, partial [Isosphaeraceae bacterium]